MVVLQCNTIVSYFLMLLKVTVMKKEDKTALYCTTADSVPIVTNHIYWKDKDI